MQALPLAQSRTQPCCTQRGRVQQPPPPAPDGAEAALRHLLSSLTRGVEAALVREDAWRQAEQVQTAQRRGALSPEQARAWFDRLQLAWSLADRMERAWQHLALGEYARAMDLASRCIGATSQLSDSRAVDRRAVERLAARPRALWQLAEGLDEVSFLSRGGQQRGARARAHAIVLRAEELAAQGSLEEGQLLLVEEGAARWGATPAWRARRGA